MQLSNKDREEPQIIFRVSFLAPKVCTADKGQGGGDIPGEEERPGRFVLILAGV